MAKKNDWEVTHVLEALRWKREQLAEHEAQWKQMREDSKQLTLRLITEHGYSVARAAELSGHHRQTISIWLKIHNAERKSAKQLAEGDES